MKIFKLLICLIFATTASNAQTHQRARLHNPQTSTSFRCYVNGIDAGNWNYGSGIVGIGQTIGTASGQAIIGDVVTAVEIGTTNWCYPLAGVSVSTAGGGILYHLGTNDCIFVDRTINYTNRSAVTRRAVQIVNGYNLGGQNIPPGGWFPFTFTDMGICKNGDADEFGVYWEDEAPQVFQDEFGLTFTNTTTRTPIVEGDASSELPSGQYTPTSPLAYSVQTNSFINFSGTSTNAANVAHDSTLQSGFNTLAQQLDSIGKKIDLTTGAVLQNGGGGEGGDVSGLETAINQFHTDNTNKLGGIGGILSMGTNYTGSGSGTNLTVAQASADDVMGSIDGQAAGVLSDLGSAPGLLGGGSADVLSFEAFGQTLNLDPDVRFPGAAAFFKSGIVLLVSLWLGRYLVDLYMKTAAIYASSETGGVPAIGPWGSVGLSIAVIVSLAVVGLWVLVFSAIFTYGLDYLSTVSDSVSGFSTSNAGALYLINLFFPITFMMSAAWTRMVAPFAVTKVIIMTASAQRFLLGK